MPSVLQKKRYSPCEPDPVGNYGHYTTCRAYSPSSLCLPLHEAETLHTREETLTPGCEGPGSSPVRDKEQTEYGRFSWTGKGRCGLHHWPFMPEDLFSYILFWYYKVDRGNLVL